MINTKDFVLLAGEPGYWDAAVLTAVECGVSTLTEMQKRQYTAGRRSAQLLKGAYCWYVRSATPSLDFLQIPFYAREEALEWGKKWADVDPANREFFARRSDLEREEKA